MQNMKKEERFWNWFAENRTKFENLLENLEDYSQDEIDTLMDEFEENLHKYDSNIWFRMGGENPYELIITAEGFVEYFENVKCLVNAVPKFEKWQIIAFIQARDISAFEYKLDGYTLTQDDVFFSYAENISGEQGYYIETMFYVVDDKYQDDEGFKSSIIRIAETSLGEYDFAKIVGFIDVKKTSQMYQNHETGLLPIYKLPEVADAIKKKINNYR